MSHVTYLPAALAIFSTSVASLTKEALLFQGHWSPIVRQMRGSSKPDGMCLVVGSCASGFPPEQNRCPAFPLLEYTCVICNVTFQESNVRII